MVHKVIKWCSKDSDPEFYTLKPELLSHTRLLPLVLNLLKFFSQKEHCINMAMSFLVVQSHAEYIKSYASVNMKDLLCLPCFSHQNVIYPRVLLSESLVANEAVFYQTHHFGPNKFYKGLD